MPDHTSDVTPQWPPAPHTGAPTAPPPGWPAPPSTPPSSWGTPPTTPPPGYAPGAAYQPYAQQPVMIAPAPRAHRGGVMRLLTSIRVVFGVIVLAAIIIGAVAHQINVSQNGQTTDGALSAGDCVTETLTEVQGADCSGSHTGKITKVLAVGNTNCPAGLESVPLKDPNSGNPVGTACIDTSDHSS